MQRMKVLLALVCVFMSAPAIAQRVRIADSQALSAGGNGWSVDPRTGSIALSIPVAMVPGELPVPILLRMNGTRSTRTTDTYVWDPRIRRWLLEESELRERPLYATQHFGYISMPTYYGSVLEPKTYVLEGGQQFREDDLVPFTTVVAGQSPAVTNFTLPTKFGLSAIPAGDVKVVGSGGVATFSATPTQLGTLASKVATVTPVNHTLPNPLTYQVAMDRDRVRVFLFLTEFSAWVPVLWADRYGHMVTFKWSRGTTNLPPGVTALHAVEVLNGRGAGVQLEWPRFANASGTAEEDLLVVREVGGGWLSMTVKGYPGVAQTAGSTILAPVIPGPMGRPTQVNVARVGTLAPTFWQGSSSLPPLAPPQNQEPSLIRSWNIAYDATRSHLQSFTEPNGTTTEFLGYSTLQLIPAETTGAVRQGAHLVDAVSETKSTAVGGEILRRRWTRTNTGTQSPVVMFEEVFGEFSNAKVKTEITYAAPTDAAAYSNGGIKTIRTLDALGAEVAKTEFGLAPAGFDGSWLSRTSETIERQGEPKRMTTWLYNVNGLQMARTTQYIGVANRKYAEQEVTYGDAKVENLDFQRPTKVKTSRFDSAGVKMLPERVEETTYDSNGRVSGSFVDGGTLGKVGTWTTYDSQGRIATQRNVEFEGAISGWTKTLQYDPVLPAVINEAIQYAGPSGVLGSLTTTFDQLDSEGRPKRITDARGVQTTLTYTDMGTVKSMARAGESQIQYDQPDLMTRTVARDGNVSTETSDGFGRVIRIESPDGSSQSAGYDIHGRQTWVRIDKRTNAQTGPSTVSATESATYDGLGRVVQRISATNEVEDIVYAVEGELRVITRTRGGVLNLITKTYVDPFGQVVKSISPTLVHTTTEFNGLGNPTRVVQQQFDSSGFPQGNFQERTFSYDALGRMTSKREEETGLTEYSEFNENGQPGRIVEKGDSTTAQRTRLLQWDGLGRLKSQAIGAQSMSYTYSGMDLNSMQTTNENGVQVIQTFSYEGGAGKRLSSETTSASGWSASLGYGYDDKGRLRSMTYPSGRKIVYGYDSYGRVRTVGEEGLPVIASLQLGDPSEFQTSQGATDWGTVSALVFASGAKSEWKGQSKDSQLRKWTVSGLASDLEANPLPANESDYLYDQAGRLSRAREWTLSHDEEDRLVSASAPTIGVPSTGHSYDAYNNAIAATSYLGADPALPGFNVMGMPKNRVPMYLSSASSTGWSYNQLGEAISIGTLNPTGQLIRTQSIGWDAFGRLWQIQEGSVTKHRVTYAPSGLRVRVEDPSTTSRNRRYAYSASGLLWAEQNDAGATLREVVYLGGRAVAELEGSVVHELHSDHLGTPRYVTKKGANAGDKAVLEASQAYGPYGERLTNDLAVKGAYTPLTGYTGHVQTDDSGLIYMRGRYYSPQWRHFLNSDHGVDPGSWNQNAYVSGSPFEFTDPTGLIKVKDTQLACENGVIVLYLTWDDGKKTREETNYPCNGWGVDGKDPWLSTVDPRQFQIAFTTPTLWNNGRTSGGTTGVKPQTPKERDCIDSVADSLKSIGGFFWPGNWNSADMGRLYEMGPLGQAEALTNPNGDFFDRNAYNLTAGSLVVSGAAVTGAVGLNGAAAFGIRSTGIMIHGPHHQFFGQAMNHLQVNFWQAGVKGTGFALRVAIPAAAATALKSCKK